LGALVSAYFSGALLGWVTKKEGKKNIVNKIKSVLDNCHIPPDSYAGSPSPQ